MQLGRLYKNIRIIILIGACALSLCSCSPASKEDALRYAEEKFGEAEYIRTQEEGDKAIIYYFKDSEYGFEYYVESKVKDINIDGSKFGESESKYSDFDEKYYSYVLEQIENEFAGLESSYGVDIRDGFSDNIKLDYKYNFAEIYYVSYNTSTAPEVGRKVNDLFAQYDTRGYWKDMAVDVYDNVGEKIGSFSYKYNQWMTPEDENDAHYIEIIKMWNPDAEYIRKEQVLFKDMGIDINDVEVTLGNEPPTDDTVYTYYYFEVDGKEYYMANIMINDGQRSDWFTNYDR